MASDQDNGRVAFVESEGVDLNYHVREVLSDPPMTMQGLDDFLASLQQRGEDYKSWGDQEARPLWFFHVIQKMDDGRSCIVFESVYSFLLILLSGSRLLNSQRMCS